MSEWSEERRREVPWIHLLFTEEECNKIDWAAWYDRKPKESVKNAIIDLVNLSPLMEVESVDVSYSNEFELTGRSKFTKNYYVSDP